MSTPIRFAYDRVERVLGVDEGADPAARLGLGDDVVDERRLARGLRAEDLDDPPARNAADPEREVERERAGRDRLHLDHVIGAELHQRAGAEVLLDLGDGGLQGLVARLGVLLAGLPQVGLCVCHLKSTSLSSSVLGKLQLGDRLVHGTLPPQVRAEEDQTYEWGRT